MKKLLKGDAHWSTKKVILGWEIDTKAGTIQLPEHRREKLAALLASLPRTKRRISKKKWQQALGELRSISLAIPGLKGLFSLLQEQLSKEENNRVALTQPVHDILDDIKLLAASMADRPTRLRETVPTPAAAIGCADAARPGMGGVFFTPERLDNNHTVERAFLWRVPFPPAIQERLVSWENPTGSITNSDLELAAALAQQDVVAQQIDIRERTIHTHSDNTPTVAWLNKGSNSKAGPAATLLRLQAFHQRMHRYHPRHDYIPGPANVMADQCSRLWNLSDEELLTHFDKHFPQVQSWTQCRLQPATNSLLTSALLGKKQEEGWSSPVPKQRTKPGLFGPSSAPTYIGTPSSPTSKTRSRSSWSTPGASATGEPPKAVNLSSVGRWTKNYARWVRRWPYWGPEIPASHHKGRSTSGSDGSPATSQNRTRHPTGQNRFHSQSFSTWRIGRQPNPTSTNTSRPQSI